MLCVFLPFLHQWLLLVEVVVWHAGFLHTVGLGGDSPWRCSLQWHPHVTCNVLFCPQETYLTLQTTFQFPQSILPCPIY